MELLSLKIEGMHGITGFLKPELASIFDFLYSNAYRI